MAKLYSSLLLLALAIHIATCLPSAAEDHESERAMEVALARVRRQNTGEDINDFLRTVLNNFKKEMTKGIPGLKIPKLDPFQMKDKTFVKNNEKTNLNLKMKDTSIVGLSKFEITKLNFDINNLKFTFGLRIPKITVKGKYDLKGKLFRILPLYGDGPFSVQVTDLSFSTTVAVTIDANGKGTLATPPHLEATFKSVRVNFSNLLGGLSNVLNNVINALGKPIFDKFRPTLMKSLKKSLIKVLNKQLAKVDITKFLG